MSISNFSRVTSKMYHRHVFFRKPERAGQVKCKGGKMGGLYGEGKRENKGRWNDITEEVEKHKFRKMVEKEGK